MDCLAAVIIAIGALPMDIRRASFQLVWERLKKIGSKVQTAETTNRQHALFHRMEEAVEESGLTGWIEWMRLYRNLLVHRGRNIGVEEVVPDSLLVGVDGLPLCWKTQIHLPKYPDLSHVEAQLASDKFGSDLLEEDAAATMARLLNGVTQFVDYVASFLLEIWMQRRENSTDAGQPGEQWKPANLRDLVRQDASGMAVARMTGSARDRRPLLAAALADDQRGVWSEPDMKEFVPKRIEDK